MLTVGCSSDISFGGLDAVASGSAFSSQSWESEDAEGAIVAPLVIPQPIGIENSV